MDTEVVRTVVLFNEHCNGRYDQYEANMLAFKGAHRGSQGPAAGCVQVVDMLDVAHQDAHDVLGRVCGVVGHDAKGEAICRLVGVLHKVQRVTRACSWWGQVTRVW